MTVCKTARYEVRPDALDECLRAVREFVAYVRDNEPGTRLYAAFREQGEATRFTHVMVFDDDAAEERHRTSAAVRRFTDALYPLTAGGVQFTDFEEVASNL